MTKTREPGKGSKPGVSVITCTNRPHFFKKLLANYQTQIIGSKELIVILNNDRMSLKEHRLLAQKVPNVRVYKLPQSYSLGRCLNYGIQQARYSFVAKFDDDDYYGPHYLTGALRAFIRSKADVVGKLTHYLYLKASNLLVLQLPNRENTFVEWIAGGTIMARRSLFRQVPFPDRSLGEDVVFLNRCTARGLRIYASDRYDYVYIRRTNTASHTWKVTDQELLNREHLVIGQTSKYKALVRRGASTKKGPLPRVFLRRKARAKAKVR